MSPGIAGVGTYAPATRLSADAIAATWGQFEGRGIAQTAVPGPDEDVLTMGYEAARNALDAAGVGGEALRAIEFATTNPPIEEGALLPRFGRMLGVTGTAETTLYTGSLTAGVRALRGADRAVTAAGQGPALVVAGDTPRGAPDEALGQGAGAGAAAFVVTDDGPARIADFSTASEPGAGSRFRQAGSERSEGLGITPFDRERFESTVTSALDDLAYTADDTDAAAVQATDGRRPYRVVDALPVSGERVRAHATVHEIGDTAAASVPLSLACALADDATGIVGVAAGSGATAAAVAVAVTGPVPASMALEGTAEAEYAAHLRQRGELTGGEPRGGGGYVSLPAWHRSLAQRYRLEAGRCSSCTRLNMPPRGACNHCDALAEYEPVELSRTGTVEAVSVISQGGAPPEFAELQARSGAYATGLIAFDGPEGESVSIPALIVEADPESVTVGDAVEMTIRRIYTQEGVTRYGFKVRPAT